MPTTQLFGGFWRRFAAYLIDAIPFTILVACTMGPAIGLPKALQTYRKDRTTANRLVYMEKRNLCRNTTALLLVVYGTLCEGSTLQGTLGKRLMRLRVTNADGDRLGWGRAFSRNVGKLLSILPLAIGFIWAAFDPRKQSWHDKIAGTLVWKHRPDLFDSQTLDANATGIK